MEGITFSLERRGYSVEEVEEYVGMLQQNYGQLEIEKAECVKLLESQQKKMEVLQNNARQRDGQYSNIIEENSTGKKRLEELERKLEEKEMNERELRMLRVTCAKLEKESEQAQETINEMSKRLGEAPETLEVPKEKEAVDELEQMSNLFKRAKVQADEYVESVKQEMETEKVQLQAEKEDIIKKAMEDAESIKVEAREEVKAELDAERLKIQEEKEQSEREKEKKISECDFLKKEAEIERGNARKEAENIIKQAEIKLDLAEEKERILVARAYSKVKRIENEMGEEYKKVQKHLIQSAEQMVALFSDIAKLEEIESVEEIAKYTEVPSVDEVKKYIEAIAGDEAD